MNRKEMNMKGTAPQDRSRRNIPEMFEKSADFE
jgi:hypothetical protein